MEPLLQPVIKRLFSQPKLLRRPHVSASLFAAPLPLLELHAGPESSVRRFLQRLWRPERLAEGRQGDRSEGIILDACHARTPDAMRNLLFTRLAGRSFRSKSLRRLVFVGREGGDLDAEASAGMLEGFVRSLAKEVAKTGCSCNLVFVQDEVLGKEDAVAGPVLWLLSPSAAYVTGQVLRVAPQAASLGEAEDIESLFSIRGRRILLTGATGGIGAETCDLLAAQGAELIISDLKAKETALQEKTDELDSVSYCVADATSPAAASEALQRAIQDRGWEEIDAVVLNAGLTRDRTLRKMSWGDWNDVIAVNLETPLKFLHDTVAAPGQSPVRFSSSGRVVLLSSISGIGGNGGQTNYAACKSALAAVAKATSTDTNFAGIRVNSIAPGFIHSEMTAKIPFLQSEVLQRMNALQQGGYPRDVAEAISFLSSQKACAGLHGQNVRVCGGHLLGR